ncbi:unnamed protein product, partial [Pleuronectes platessa]
YCSVTKLLETTGFNQRSLDTTVLDGSTEGSRGRYECGPEHQQNHMKPRLEGPVLGDSLELVCLGAKKSLRRARGSEREGRGLARSQAALVSHSEREVGFKGGLVQTDCAGTDSLISQFTEHSNLNVRQYCGQCWGQCCCVEVSSLRRVHTGRGSEAGPVEVDIQGCALLLILRPTDHDTAASPPSHSPNIPTRLNRANPQPPLGSAGPTHPKQSSSPRSLGGS